MHINKRLYGLEWGIYRASSLAALGLQNLPLLSIFGSISLADIVDRESLGFPRVSSSANAELQREVRGENTDALFLGGELLGLDRNCGIKIEDDK